MMSSPLKVLLVEDNPADVYLLRKLLAAGEPVELVHAERLDEAIGYLHETSFGAVLLDLSLPDSQGLNTVKKTHQASPDVPILVLTILDDEEIAIAALRAGAQDYLVKGQINRIWLVRAIHYAIERQQTLDKLQHLNQELARSNQELEQFAHVVSHDLQQPLQSILGFAQLLEVGYRDHAADEPVNQYIAHIVKASRRMSGLIQDLLAYSQVSQSAPSREPVDCNQVMAQILSDFKPVIRERQATVTTDSLPRVNGNKTRLAQLFQNLLSNALKYHPPDQAPQITVSVQAQEALWRFGIHDNGIGIDPGDFDRIFQIFRRLHSAADYPGTGIGLAICKKIVENHGGRIWVDSGPTAGTTFYFTLPALAEA
ncbi:MAG: ATP-binding protein [Phormidesmis sp.]